MSLDSLNSRQSICSCNRHSLSLTSSQGFASYCGFGDRKKKWPLNSNNVQSTLQTIKQLKSCEKFAKWGKGRVQGFRGKKAPVLPEKGVRLHEGGRNQAECGQALAEQGVSCQSELEVLKLQRWIRIQIWNQVVHGSKQSLQLSNSSPSETMGDNRSSLKGARFPWGRG